MHPNPGELWTPKPMFVLSRQYESRCGNLSLLAHVFAIGNGELLRNSMLGAGVIPAGGIDDSPVANISTSSRDTVVCVSAR